MQTNRSGVDDRDFMARTTKKPPQQLPAEAPPHVGLWHGAVVGGGVKDGRLVDVVDEHGEHVALGVEVAVKDDAADEILVRRLEVQQRLASRDRVQLQLAR